MSIIHWICLVLEDFDIWVYNSLNLFSSWWLWYMSLLKNPNVNNIYLSLLKRLEEKVWRYLRGKQKPINQKTDNTKPKERKKRPNNDIQNAHRNLILSMLNLSFGLSKENLISKMKIYFVLGPNKYVIYENMLKLVFI